MGIGWTTTQRIYLYHTVEAQEPPRAWSMSDAERGNEYAAELDRVKSIEGVRVRQLQGRLPAA